MDYACKFFRILSLSFYLAISGYASAQSLYVQIKAMDEKLNSAGNIAISINDSGQITIDSTGTAFVEIAEDDLPPKEISIRNKELEAASWNYSKGILEIIIREKTYKEISVEVQEQGYSSVANTILTFTGSVRISSLIDGDGMAYFKLPVNENYDAISNFSLPEYNINSIEFEGLAGTMVVSKIKKVEAPSTDTVLIVESEPTRSFSFLDTITSMGSFYKILKTMNLKELKPTQKNELDTKFYELLSDYDSIQQQPTIYPSTRFINDSSLIKSDVDQLLLQLKQNSGLLDRFKHQFTEKVDVINKKLEESGPELSQEDRNLLSTNVDSIEYVLSNINNKFIENQAEYQQVIDELRKRLLSLEGVEQRLLLSEKERALEEQLYRKRLLRISLIVLGLIATVILLIYLVRLYIRQRNQLAKANAEIKHINENLENLVAQKTESLNKINKELDTFLYRSSHDLRRPLSSIIGLNNIAKLTLTGESLDLFNKAATTAVEMDSLLQKLQMVFHINHPAQAEEIDFNAIVKRIEEKYHDIIEENHIEFIKQLDKSIRYRNSPAIIEIILTNLLENAFQYVSLKDDKKGQVLLNVFRKNGSIGIKIRDNGVGVEDGVKDKIWEMFYVGNSHSKGNGLGLFIARKAIMEQNGEITLKSTSGEYTECLVMLPSNPQ